jgi:hypothetical protein
MRPPDLLREHVMNMRSLSCRETKLVRSGLRLVALGCLIVLPAAGGFTSARGQDKAETPAAGLKPARETLLHDKNGGGEPAAVEESEEPVAFALAAGFRGELFSRTKRPGFSGLKCWATAPSGGPQGCGARFVFVPLFPAAR